MDVARIISRVQEPCREEQSPKLLWVDLRRRRSGNPASESVAAFYRVDRVCDVAAISPVVDEWMPHVLCFDFDVPDAQGLCAMRQLKHRHCHVPVLMLTEYHSKELALFALRSRAEDYLVKPVTTQLLLSTLQAVFDRGCERHESFLNARWKQAGCKTHHAVTHIETNFGVKIDLKTAAERCHLSPSRFCRVFKKEHGMTFSDYLMRHRVSTARELLASSPSPIKEVAFAVGFDDLSYFSRVFRRYAGASPSEYAAGKLEALAAHRSATVADPTGLVVVRHVVPARRSGSLPRISVSTQESCSLQGPEFAGPLPITITTAQRRQRNSTNRPS